jgi:hypothetical protein
MNDSIKIQILRDLVDFLQSEIEIDFYLLSTRNQRRMAERLQHMAQIKTRIESDLSAIGG